jgi:hypothetical protein
MTVSLSNIVKDSFMLSFKGRGKEFLWRMMSIFGFTLLLYLGLLLDMSGRLRVEVLACMLTLIALVISIMVLGIIGLRRDPVSIDIGKTVGYCLILKPSVMQSLTLKDAIQDVERCTLVLYRIKRELELEEEYNKRSNKVDIVAIQIFRKLWSFLYRCSVLCKMTICRSTAGSDAQLIDRIGKLHNRIRCAFLQGIVLLERDLQGKEGIKAIAETRNIVDTLHEQLLPEFKQCCRRLLEQE